LKDFRILWHSVAPFITTGYGIVTKNFGLRIGNLYSTVISCYYGMHPGGSVVFSGTKCLPTTLDDWGKSSVEHYIKNFSINLPILHTDFWPFSWFAKLPHSFLYGPIDSYSYIAPDIETMKDFKYFVPCSKFGARVYESLTKKKPTDMIPHGVDTKVYIPIKRTDCRKLFNIRRNDIVIGVVSANNDPEPRKGWDDIFMAIERFLEEFPSEKKRLKLFAFTKPSQREGYDLPTMARSCHLENNVTFPEHLIQMVGLPEPEMAKLYNCFNFLLNASRREGFCLPVLEAQACGVPVVAPRSSSLTELVEGHGFMVKEGPKVFAQRGWECHKIDPEDLSKNLEKAYFDIELRRKYSKASHEFAQQYDWDLLFKNKWVPLLDSFKKLKEIK